MSCFGSLSVDISGTRQDIKKRSTAFIHVFHARSYEKIKISFHIHNRLGKYKFNSFLPVGHGLLNGLTSNSVTEGKSLLTNMIIFLL